MTSQTLNVVRHDPSRALVAGSAVAALTTPTYAYSTDDVDGVSGKQVPGKPVSGKLVGLPERAGPESIFGSTDDVGVADLSPAE